MAETENIESSNSAVSWAAIICGAVAAVAITLLLVALGTGIGFSSVSPWSFSNPSVTTFSLLAAIWLLVVQWLSSASAGYLAGRLRTKWAGLNADEAFFRDTAHGFLAWALASVLLAVVATSAFTAAVGTATRAAGSAIGGAASGAGQVAASQSPASTDYLVDTLFRADQPQANALPQQTSAEAGRILTRSIANGSLEAGDRAYLARLVAARTGLSQQDAEKRVDDVAAQAKAAVEKAKEAADAARKAAATASFFTFFSMLVGAFIASVAGAIGGRHRDEI
ncbi:MAG: hypothetical protein WDN25_29350 [Acetobacteraceae bacterium]